MMNRKIFLIGIAVGVSVMLAASAITIAINQFEAEAVTGRLHRVQTTEMSTPCTFGGHTDRHVLAVPPRTDGRMWSGTITWSASMPVELAILHGYDEGFATGLDLPGEPTIVTFGTGKVALTLLNHPGDNSAPASSGSMRFTGDAVAFHTGGSKDFTVSYTVDALAKRVDRDVCPYPNCQ